MRRRPTRLRTRVDKDATAAMHFQDKDSYVALDGRHIYQGQDATIARAKAWATWNGKCAYCGKPVRHGDEDWDHINSKGRHLRDDHPRNRRFVHGMMSAAGCHRKAHNREARWTPQQAAAIAKGLNT